MYSSNYIYHHDDLELLGFLAHKEGINEPCPAVLVAHDWTGRGEFACQKAKLLAEMGYIGFALDMYGQGRLGSNNDEKMALMQPLANDRLFLRKRLCAALEAIKTIPIIDTTRIAIIGFCFGGLCALDMARSGADIKGAVSFHGLLNKPDNLKSEKIKAKVLVLHGYDDPLAKPEQVQAFCQEMTEANVDWQMHMYGHVKHAFTNPVAHDESLGLIYDETAARRSWQAMHQFLQEIF
ncbi:DeoR faimly transcriptional regulator [Legionella norrlandica]|uniref:DeoR faimly transcriptional regulator n=1 Tax=Legionella norrlandica TaxID=1498499 RepID=A0A0A2SPG6_9GAMM|nr:dienelactone hydrolase family protein [Legionella norrlandica]KGP62647.1 DeoR faimly transcriptional regulator [Legionella norrlandica]